MTDGSGSDLCGSCQAALPRDAATCPHCGAPVAPAGRASAQFFTRPRPTGAAQAGSPVPSTPPVEAIAPAQASAPDVPVPSPVENAATPSPTLAVDAQAGAAASAPVALCWFCRTRPAEARSEARYELHRDTHRGYTVQSGRLGGRVRYRQLFVPVPRCCACRGAHIWAHRWAMVGLWLGLLFGTMAGFVLILVSKNPAVMLLGLAALPAGVYAGAWLGRRLYELRAAGRGAGRWRRGDAYPAVAAQIAQGWRPGKPFLVSK